MGGHRPLKLEDERDWLLTRLAEKPDLTLDALVLELAERRGVVVVRDTLLPQKRRYQFQKNRSRQRAGST